MIERSAGREQKTDAMAKVVAIAGLGTILYLSKRVRELKHEATHDGLTGLLNERGIEELLDKKTPPQAILYVDGTNQKAINDTLGHDRGDMAIIGTAEVLRTSLRPQDIAARIGGDEFVALLNPEPRKAIFRPAEEIVGAVISRMHETTQDYLDRNPDLRELGFDIAVGGAVWQSGMSIPDLRQMAESNMYAEKAQQHERGIRYR